MDQRAGATLLEPVLALRLLPPGVASGVREIAGFVFQEPKALLLVQSR
ncbi:hypothetical protein [Streptomyces sp. NPDC056730]